jgi:hypothetical protein
MLSGLLALLGMNAGFAISENPKVPQIQGGTKRIKLCKMAAFNFQAQFLPLIESGIKGGTIRAYRKYRQQEGKPMHLYYGLRRIKPAHQVRPQGLDWPPRCVSVQSIIIRASGQVFLSYLPWVPRTALSRPKIFGFIELQPDEKEHLALFDGFESFDQMMKYWEGRLPFLGHWCCWRTPPGRVIPPISQGAANPLGIPCVSGNSVVQSVSPVPHKTKQASEK